MRMHSPQESGYFCPSLSNYPGCPSHTLVRARSPDPGGECRAEDGQQHCWNAGLCAHQPATEGLLNWLILSPGLLHYELCFMSWFH